jgi:hypothetical protein
LESSEKQIGWVKMQQKRGVELYEWHVTEVERLNRYWAKFEKRDREVEEPSPKEVNILSLFMDERKTESAHFMLFEKWRLK